MRTGHTFPQLTHRWLCLSASDPCATISCVKNAECNVKDGRCHCVDQFVPWQGACVEQLCKVRSATLSLWTSSSLVPPCVNMHELAVFTVPNLLLRSFPTRFKTSNLLLFSTLPPSLSARNTLPPGESRSFHVFPSSLFLRLASA